MGTSANGRYPASRHGEPDPYFPDRGRHFGRYNGNDPKRMRYSSPRAPVDGSTSSRRPRRFSSDTVANAIPLEQIKRPNSRWDIPAKGYEKISVEQIKLSGAYTPGMALLADAIPPELLSIVNIAPLTPNHSVLMRVVRIRGGDPREYLQSLYTKAGFTEDISQIPYAVHSDSVLLILPSAKHVAYAMAVPGSYVVERPAGLVTTLGGSIYTSQKTRMITGLDEGATVESVKAAFPQITSGPIILKAVSGECLGAAFATFEQESPDESVVKYLFPTSNLENEAIAEAAVPEFANLANSEGRVKSTVMQIMNIYDSWDFGSDEDLAHTLGNVHRRCQEFGPVVQVQVSSIKSLLPRVLVAFESEDSCKAGVEALAGVLYAGRPLVTAFFNQDDYQTKVF